jgi:hypothetical protein
MAATCPQQHGSGSLFERPFLLIGTRDGVIALDFSKNKAVISSDTEVETTASRIYTASYEDQFIEQYDYKGNFIRRISVPKEASCLWFAALPDGFALLDNTDDKVYFIDSGGTFIAAADIKDTPDRHMQNIDAIVVDNMLVVSENGDRQLMKVDLDSYATSVFRDLQELSGWLGAVDYSDGIYYLCQSSKIYSFSESSSPALICTLGEGNITGIVVYQGYAYVTVNFSGRIYRVNLEDGSAEIFFEGLNDPSDIALARIDH